MKLGFKTPSVKKSLKARTTGAAKRKAKSTYKPTYSAKGMGYAKSPKKAFSNKVYKKTTKSFWDIFK